MKEDENLKMKFWSTEGGVKIYHLKLINFISELGYVRVKVDKRNYVLAKMNDNRLSLATEADITNDVRLYLDENATEDVLESFIRGIAGYITSKKLDLLPSIELIKDRDPVDGSYFFFNNCYVKVEKDRVQPHDYKTLEFPIWESRILSHNFQIPQTDESYSLGQFESFCKNITGNQTERLESLKTMLGYLLHRNKEFGEPKAVILYDANMGYNNQANGGTGKTLLSMALSKCREVESFDAKELKIGSWFKNQRIELTTDIVVYDDLKKDFSFEHFFPMITSGIEVEKKRQQSFSISYEDSPKIMISSNYIVRGPGGSSDSRRRYEFELLNHYDQNFTPEMEFGNKFFGSVWSQEEWNKFYFFMMNCVMDYFQRGLVEAKQINLEGNRLSANSSPEFIEYIEEFIPKDEWCDKRTSLIEFKELYPKFSSTSSHKFHKWIADYAGQSGLNYEDKSTGGDYKFILKSKNGEQQSYI